MDANGKPGGTLRVADAAGSVDLGGSGISAGVGDSAGSVGSVAAGGSAGAGGACGPGAALATIGVGGITAAANVGGAPLSVPVPFQSKIVLLEDVRVAGTAHIRGIDAIVAGLEPGMRLRLERDPGNLADHWAIRVFAGDNRIGFVPADCNEVLARLMDGGKALSAELTGKEKIGTWNKLHMEVSLDD